MGRKRGLNGSSTYVLLAVIGAISGGLTVAALLLTHRELRANHRRMKAGTPSRAQEARRIQALEDVMAVAHQVAPLYRPGSRSTAQDIQQ